MTKVTFFCNVDNLSDFSGFCLEGHSGFAAEGEDILCAAITASVRLVESMMTDSLEIETEVQVAEAYLKIILPQSLEEKKQFACEMLIKSLHTQFSLYSLDYPDFLTIILENNS